MSTLQRRIMIILLCLSASACPIYGFSFGNAFKSMGNSFTNFGNGVAGVATNSWQTTSQFGTNTFNTIGNRVTGTVQTSVPVVGQTAQVAYDASVQGVSTLGEALGADELPLAKEKRYTAQLNTFLDSVIEELSRKPELKQKTVRLVFSPLGWKYLTIDPGLKRQRTAGLVVNDVTFILCEYIDGAKERPKDQVTGASGGKREQLEPSVFGYYDGQTSPRFYRGIYQKENQELIAKQESGIAQASGVFARACQETLDALTASGGALRGTQVRIFVSPFILRNSTGNRTFTSNDGVLFSLVDESGGDLFTNQLLEFIKDSQATSTSAQKTPSFSSTYIAQVRKKDQWEIIKKLPSSCGDAIATLYAAINKVNDDPKRASDVLIELSTANMIQLKSTNRDALQFGSGDSKTVFTWIENGTLADDGYLVSYKKNVLQDMLSVKNFKQVSELASVSQASSVSGNSAGVLASPSTVNGIPAPSVS